MAQYFGLVLVQLVIISGLNIEKKKRKKKSTLAHLIRYLSNGRPSYSVHSSRAQIAQSVEHQTLNLRVSSKDVAKDFLSTQEFPKHGINEFKLQNLIIIGIGHEKLYGAIPYQNRNALIEITIIRVKIVIIP